MSMIRLLLAALVVCACLHYPALAQNQEAKPNDDSKENVVVREIDERNVSHYIEANPSGTHEITKQFGAIRGPFYGGDILVGTMKLVNRTGDPLIIKGIEADQSKIKVEAPLGTFQDGEEFYLTYRLEVSKNSTHTFASIALMCDGTLKRIKVAMDIAVSDVASFLYRTYSFSSDAHQNTKLKLRVVFTGDLQASDVRITGTGDLAHLNWKIVRETSDLNIHDFAVAELAADEIPPIGLLETVSIENLRTKMTDQARVQVFYNGAFRIAPNVAHLRSDPKDNLLVAHLVIALNSLRDIGVNTSSDVSVSASVNGSLDCKVDKQVMGNTGLRIRLGIDPEAIKKLPGDSLVASVKVHGNEVRVPLVIH